LERAAKVVSNQAQKLVAQSKQKSDPNAPSGKKLTAAGHTVVEAIEGLLAAGEKFCDFLLLSLTAGIDFSPLLARNAADRARESEAMATTRDVPFDERAQANGELKIQLEIARLEKELEMVKVRDRRQDLNESFADVVFSSLRRKASCDSNALVR
jgi:hypothetical protein